MLQWTKENQTLSIIIVVGIVLLLALAMWLGQDLSWVPDLLAGLVK